MHRTPLGINVLSLQPINTSGHSPTVEEICLCFTITLNYFNYVLKESPKHGNRGYVQQAFWNKFWNLACCLNKLNIKFRQLSSPVVSSHIFFSFCFPWVFNIESGFKLAQIGADWSSGDPPGDFPVGCWTIWDRLLLQKEGIIAYLHIIDLFHSDIS